MRLAFQIITALMVGVCYYMLAMAMTVYDGILSLIFQPIVGTIITSIAIAVLLVLGLPIRHLPRLHQWWRKHGWFVFVLGTMAFGMMHASWLPPLRIQTTHPDLGTSVDSFHPVLAFGGWMLTIFSVLHFYPPLPWFRPRQRKGAI